MRKIMLYQKRRAGADRQAFFDAALREQAPLLKRIPGLRRLTVSLEAEGFNLLDRKDHEIDYFYPSFIPGVDPASAAGTAPAGVSDIHFKPVEPIAFRAGVTIRF